MRMLTVSAIGLALALPLAVASAPARADDGDVYNQNTSHLNQQNDHDRYGQRSDLDQYNRDSQRADADHDAYRHAPTDNGRGQAMQGAQDGRGDQFGQQQDRYRRDGADQAQTQQAQRDQYHHDGDYIQQDRDAYNNDHDSARYGHRPYDQGDNSDRD
jgi:hypothetical protein